MIQIPRNNNLSPLPFYDYLAWQDKNKSYAFGAVYPLYAPKENLLPFQIIVPHDAAVVNDVLDVRIFCVDHIEIANITQNLIDGGMIVKKFPDSDTDIILYPANMPALAINVVGQHYLRVKFRGKTYYSEIMTLVDSIDNFLKIEFWDNDNLYFENGLVTYENQYKNRLYLSTEVGKPEYTFVDNGNDRDGFYFPEKQLSEKTYRFITTAPEYLCDLLRIVRLSDKVRVYSNGIMYKCDTFLLTVKWLTQGNLASIECEYQTDTVVKKIGRGSAPNIEIYGKVVNYQNRPILGVSVKLSSGGIPIATAITDSSGNFAYEWIVSEQNYHSPITAIFEKDGYAPQTKAVYIDFGKAIRRGVNFETVIFDTSIIVSTEWGGFINIWIYQAETVATLWDEFINIFRETCQNGYSHGYSRAYNCTSPENEITIIPDNISLPQSGDGVNVEVITQHDWTVE